MQTVEYRKAKAEDSAKITGLIRAAFDGPLQEHGFFETSPFASPKLPPIPEQGFPWFEMALEEDANGFWVAEVEGDLAGVALSWVRGSLWYLAHLFVSTNRQGLNIGQELLQRALDHHKDAPITNRALVTFAYNPVSISLYARHGIYPREPLYFMECSREQVHLADTHAKLRSEKAEDFADSRRTLSRIDELSIGYPRERNHELLFSLPSVRCYIFSAGAEPIGYAYIWQNGRLGPLATISQTDFTDAVKSAMRLAAAQQGPTVGMLVTGSNAELMKVALGQSMRIMDNYLLMSSRPFPNFSNYLLYPTGAML